MTSPSALKKVFGLKMRLRRRPILREPSSGDKTAVKTHAAMMTLNSLGDDIWNANTAKAMTTEYMVRGAPSVSANTRVALDARCQRRFLLSTVRIAVAPSKPAKMQNAMAPQYATRTPSAHCDHEFSKASAIAAGAA